MENNKSSKSIKSLWKDFLISIEEDVNDKIVYMTFLLDTNPIVSDDSKIYIMTKSVVAKEVLQNKFISKIEELLNNYFNTNLKVEFIFEGEDKVLQISEKKEETKSKGRTIGLVGDNNFQNFVVGDFNRTAYSACTTIVSSPGTRWNPLFIYGSTGLGKTHLASATGYDYAKKYPDKIVRFMSTETFTREVHEAFKAGSSEVENIKKSFLDYDMLIIDDVQFLSGREKTSEIFFNIFNDFINSKKHIIMTSDKKPEQLNGFEERMISRFSSGLSVEIKTPEEEAIKIILQHKIRSSNFGFELEEDAIQYISHIFNTDIRKLEGALQKIYFNVISSFKSESKISKETCVKIFEGDTVRSNGPNINSPEFIIENICRIYGVDQETIRSKSRISQIAKIRQEIMYILREKTNMTLLQIGIEFGRDHTTVISSIEKVKERIEKDNDYSIKIKKIINSLNK